MKRVMARCIRQPHPRAPADLTSPSTDAARSGPPITGGWWLRHSGSMVASSASSSTAAASSSTPTAAAPRPRPPRQAPQRRPLLALGTVARLTSELGHGGAPLSSRSDGSDTGEADQSAPTLEAVDRVTPAKQLRGDRWWLQQSRSGRARRRRRLQWFVAGSNDAGSAASSLSHGAGRLGVIAFGSVPLKSYLPDGDVDITVLGNTALHGTCISDVHNILESEEQDSDAELEIKGVQFINAEVKLIKCVIENIVVDISFNQIGGVSTLCFLEL
ncbi:hypothetical protein E2562_030053, partial [Oryza meyeriana var. granulata]